MKASSFEHPLKHDRNCWREAAQTRLHGGKEHHSPHQNAFIAVEYVDETIKTYFISVASKLYGVNATIIIFVFVLYCIVLYFII